MKLAPYATRSEASLGRVVFEPASAVRSEFQRDRDRIVHCRAFRRLEYKTQVLVNFEGDHFRTRLTHSLEVAQIARTLARTLHLNEDLAETAALAHDLGHSPFGHAGEAALDQAMREFGGFDHNLQTFRILTEIEHRYAGFDGLNLTVEALEAVLKHNGPLSGALPSAIARHPIASMIDLAAQAPLEAQAAAIADDVAYCNHDLDDGLRAGFFDIESLRSLPIAGGIVGEVEARWPDLEFPRMVHETNRRLIDAMVRDLVAESRRRIETIAPRNVDAVRAQASPMIAFSTEMGDAVAELRTFLSQRMYRHYKVNRMSLKAQRVVAELVEVFMTAPDCLPDHWRAAAGPPGSAATAGAVRDYVAGMTDRFALDEHDRLFELTRPIV